MKNFFSVYFFKVLVLSLVILTGFSSCDDGEIVVKDFDFDNVALKTCNSAAIHVFYKSNDISFESLSLRLEPGFDLYGEAKTHQFTLNGSSNFVNYRRFDSPLGSNYFCTSVPPSSPAIIDEYKAVSGIAVLTVTFRTEDNKLHKDVQIVLKDITLTKEKETIILQTLDMGTIQSVQTVDL